MKEIKGMEYAECTEQVLSCAFEVSNELGIGFLESVYEKALFIALQEKGLKVEQQVGLQIEFRGKPVGQFFIDLLVEDLLIIELKAAKAIAPEHEMQLLNYLRGSTKPVGLILNFGTPKLEYRRYNNRFLKNL
jgi:GxxExxY protein